MNLFASLLLFFSVHYCSSFEIPITSQYDSGAIQIVFKHKVRNEVLELNNKTYINPSSEAYTVSVLKYYISNITLQHGKTPFAEANSYHLIDAAKESTQSVLLKLPEGVYTSICFLIGVDSLHNVSGAQDGELDPLKGMFWSWNTGYIMAKLEGNSPASNFNNKFEYHVGGFDGAYNTVHQVTLNFSKPITIHRNSINMIHILTDINTWWGNKKLNIKHIPGTATPGVMAKMISDNYSKMFSIE